MFGMRRNLFLILKVALVFIIISTRHRGVISITVFLIPNFSQQPKRRHRPKMLGPCQKKRKKMFIWAFLYVILLDSSGSQVIYLSTNQRWMDRLLTQAEFIFWTILSLDNSEWPDQFYIRLSSDRKGTFFYWTYGVIWSDRSYNPKLSFAYEVKK